MTQDKSPRDRQRSAKSRLARRLALRGLATFLGPALWGYTLLRRHVKKKSLASTRGMWGHLAPESREILRHARAHDGARPVIWLHAVSVGEVMAARVIARALKQARSEGGFRATVFLSVTTDTGMETARAAQIAGEVDAVGFYPIDHPVALRRALNEVRPNVFATLETELWPLFLGECRARNIKTLLLNGRVSDRLQRDAARFSWLFGPLLGNFDALLMRSEFDASRMRIIAGDEAPIVVAGDVKLDAAPPAALAAASPEQVATGESTCWKEVLGVAAEQRLWVAGSTHAGEEEILARAYKSLKLEFPSLRLLLAPRHIERAPQVLGALHKMNLPAHLRSAAPSTCPSTWERDEIDEIDEIIVLDTVGELSEIYGAADVAFVGGSLIERGGHNMLEPVLRGVPVAFGPHVANFRVAAALVEEHDLGRKIEDENSLRQALALWLGERGESGKARADFASRVEKALRSHRGASVRVAQILARAAKRSGRASAQVLAPAPPHRETIP